jgi:hypothetical protein
MAAHPESARPQQDDETAVPPPISPLPAPEPAPVPDGNRLSRRARRGGGTPSGRAGKVQPGGRQGLVPSPRQYSTRRRG